MQIKVNQKLLVAITAHFTIQGVAGKVIYHDDHSNGPEPTMMVSTIKDGVSEPLGTPVPGDGNIVITSEVCKVVTSTTCDVVHITSTVATPTADTTIVVETTPIVDTTSEIVTTHVTTPKVETSGHHSTQTVETGTAQTPVTSSGAESSSDGSGLLAGLALFLLI